MSSDANRVIDVGAATYAPGLPDAASSWPKSLADGPRSPGLQARLDALEAERADIARQMTEPPPSPVRLHPNLAELYCRKVAALHEALHVEETRGEAFKVLRSLIDMVLVHAREGGGGGGGELIGEIASMVQAASPNAKKTPWEGRLGRVIAAFGARNHLYRTTLRFPCRRRPKDRSNQERKSRPDC